MTTPTIDQFKTWAQANRSLAMAVCKAKVVAEMERERVNKYTVPVFLSYNFKDEEGKPIADKDRLYLCKDEERVAEYFEKCNALNRTHGWNGPYEHCPALVAESRQVKIENTLIKAGLAMMGAKVDFVYGDNREKMLDLLLGACLKKS